MKDRMKLSLSPEIGLKGKLVWVLVISFCEKISFPVTCLMPYYAQAKLAVLIT
jgi:hypothetical protein